MQLFAIANYSRYSDRLEEMLEDLDNEQMFYFMLWKVKLHSLVILYSFHIFFKLFYQTHGPKKIFIF